MSKLRVNAFSVSLDGYGAGLAQDIDNPMGQGGMPLHGWIFGTKTGRAMIGQSGGDEGVDDDFMKRGFENVGAWILGRNMFGPVRGPWLDDAWKGWWGETPPYHVPVFVLTHHARAPLEMDGGTTFHFVTDGIEAALRRAKDAAGSKDVRLGGGVATLREYVRARHVDEMHFAITPAIVGAGEHLWRDIDMPKLGYKVVEHVAGKNALHVVLAKT